MASSSSHPNLVDSTHPSTNVPVPSEYQYERGYGNASNSFSQQNLSLGTATTDFGSKPNANQSPLAQVNSNSSRNAGKFNEEWDASQRGSSIIDGPSMNRSTSVMSQGDTLIPSRGGTLKKKPSLKRGNSLKRSGSKRSSRAGSVRSLALQPEAHDEIHSAFFSPVPTTGNPTEILANRFAAWRKVLKDLITYFREIQTQYDHRSKTLLKISNVINNTQTPSIFLQSGGIDDALQILRQYHKQSIMEANKSKDIENDVILALTGLRSDLQQKIKEIKNLSGDFKNSVEKEMDGTRRAVQQLGEALGQSDVDPAQMTGKQDPYLLRLAVDRQVEKQIDEENYLHQAYLNLETSGRELEAIVVGEIQKSHNALAGILKREGEEALETVDLLRTGPIAMPKDTEWNAFVMKDEHFVDPNIPVRQAQNIHYPGRDHELASEVRAGLLERKSKYLKSYTAGWYVLSPTHLHEFKSADKTQAPIMSLYLPEQKLGSHSNEGASSNKFMLKGRQTGSLHRGHSWVFRAESYDTMMAWFEDIKTLTETSPQERTAFVRQHARSVSGTSQKAGSISSDGVLDEEDDEPFSAQNSAVAAPGLPRQDSLPRPPAGGRFPSDLTVNAARGLQVPLSPSSGSSAFGDQDHDAIAAAAGVPGSGIGEHYPEPYGTRSMSPTQATKLNQAAEEDGMNPYTYEPIQKRGTFGNGGLDGAALSPAETEAHRDLVAAEAPEVAAPNAEISHHSHLASQEAALISAHDTEYSEKLAAAEAATIAAPDTDLVSDPEKSLAPFMAGGRPTGDVTQTPISPPTFAGESATIPATAAPAAMAQTHAAPKENNILVGNNTNTVFADPFPAKAMPVQAQTDSVPVALDTSSNSVPQRPNTLSEQLRAGQHNSQMSVTQLHVPGEYPRGSI